MECVEFEWIKLKDVNNYVAKDINGKYKYKGAFLEDLEIWKNKSERIVALAANNYFKTGDDPSTFIKNHKNIYDFCIRYKTNRLCNIEEIKSDGTIIKHKKLIRAFISKTGSVFKKVGFDKNNKPVNSFLTAEIEELNYLPKATYFNKFYIANDYNIDYDYYIYKTLKLICNTEKSTMFNDFIDRKTKGVLSLF